MKSSDRWQHPACSFLRFFNVNKRLKSIAIDIPALQLWSRDVVIVVVLLIIIIDDESLMLEEPMHIALVIGLLEKVHF
jgi:hypothetical protein